MAMITAILNNFTIFLECLALLIGIVFLPGSRNKYNLLFIPFLLFVIGIEMAGVYYSNVLKMKNHFLFNILMFVQAGFFTQLFYRFFKSDVNKKMAVALWILFLIIYCFQIIGVGFTTYFKICRVFLSVIVVFQCLTFYFSLLRNDDIISPVKYGPFWIITGLFFFYFGSVSVFAFADAISSIRLAGETNFYKLIMSTLSFIFYGSWCAGFICLKQQTK